jgi:transcriptional regulator with XRE-family HTH domain
MLKKELGISIKARRKALKVSQPELAEIAGVSVNTLYKIEKGQANPTIEILEKIVDTLGMEICLKIKKLERTDR